MKFIKILVVEDNRLILSMMQRMFTAVGCKVDIATNAKEAIYCVIKNEYQLIVTDIGLPDADGVELVDEIRSLEKQKNCMSAYICGVTAFDIEL